MEDMDPDAVLQEAEREQARAEKEQEREREREAERRQRNEAGAPRPRDVDQPARPARKQAVRPPSPAPSRARGPGLDADDLRRQKAELDIREAELRAWEARLRAEQAPATPAQAEADARGMQRWRISVPGVVIATGRVTVKPRDGAVGPWGSMPSVEYDLQTLARVNHRHPQNVAWAIYAQEQGFTDLDRKHFRCVPEVLGLEKSLEVEAASEADAWARFMELAGISSTTQQPTIDRLGPVEA